MRITKRHIGLLTIWIFSLNTLAAQETVFSGLGSSMKRADRHYQNQSFHNALRLYQELESRGKGGDHIYLKLARTSDQLNLSDRVVKWYEMYLQSNNTLPPEDALAYADGLTSQGQYQQAIAWLKKFKDYDPDNKDILKKIWRLQNIHHLYADSSYYDVRPVNINTGYAEFGPAFLDQDLIFVSNRKEKRGISKVDQVTGKSFQSLYKVEIDYDTVNNQFLFGKPALFLREWSNGLHLGTIAATEDQLIFTRTGLDQNTGKSVLQLFLAKKVSGSWKEENAFQYNSNEYSLSHPALSADGNTLYFVSDMPGGQGGNDLYKCQRTDKGWSVPVNLGETINTRGDENAPFIHRDKTLYFASNGHGGFGGLDIVKISTDPEFPSEVENLGFPVNSSHDDFGLILNMDGTHGFMASNRKSGGFDDDIYQVEVDLQSYPLTISGVVRYHDPDWVEASRQELLPLAALSLTDNRRNTVVYETTSDRNGRFTLLVPYSSQYRIKVTNEKVGELMVSLEIPKNRKRYTDHEIVVVKEKFKGHRREPTVVNSQSMQTGNKRNHENP